INAQQYNLNRVRVIPHPSMVLGLNSWCLLADWCRLEAIGRGVLTCRTWQNWRIDEGKPGTLAF
ncbi:MAG: hypothetical protein ACODAD_06630, partial [Planctomycetota bacterium]